MVRRRAQLDDIPRACLTRSLLVLAVQVEAALRAGGRLSPALAGGYAPGPRRPGDRVAPPGVAAMSAMPAATGGESRGGDQPTVDAEHAETWQLVKEAQAGNGEAFGQLYDRYFDTVYRYIYYRVNDRALAEDFTSETFLRALRRIGGIAYQGRDIGAWFVTIARNIVLDHVKSARHRLEVPTADVIESGDSSPSPEATVLQNLSSERLLRAVRQLGDEQRECVILRFLQGLSVGETAQIMGKNDGAVKALQHRAIRKLAELLGGDVQ